MKSNKKGFTLIELIIVVAIIGILAISAIGGYNKYIDRSRQTKAESEVATIEIAVTQYNADHPNGLINTTALLNNSFSTLVSQGYLQKLPEYNGKNSCTYFMDALETNKNPHVFLRNCSFTDTNKYPNGIAVY